eukprot:2969150-Pyramimonas_sp.AAC.1
MRSASPASFPAGRKAGTVELASSGKRPPQSIQHMACQRVPANFSCAGQAMQGGPSMPGGIEEDLLANPLRAS